MMNQYRLGVMRGPQGNRSENTKTTSWQRFLVQMAVRLKRSLLQWEGLTPPTWRRMMSNDVE
jgi:hypothetical protein